MNNSQKTNDITLDDLRRNIQDSYSEIDSWRKVGKLYGLQPSMARLIANGYEPGKKIRKALGLPPIATVIVMAEGEIPEGTQVIMAVRCECGRWYISNHPARQRCFICRPYKGNRK